MADIVIVGGRLQGGEAAYLAREAGIGTILIDIDPMAPVQNLCSGFVCGDVLGDDPNVLKALENADMILPATESHEVLRGLVSLCDERGYTLAFDIDAYEVTSSKRASDELFVSGGLPCPEYWPGGSMPYIAKLDYGSGSRGIKLFTADSEVYGGGSAEFRTFIAEGGADKYVVQEFVSGPSYSVEIIGTPGNYRVYEPTQIFVDSGYDCNVAAVNRVVTGRKKELLAGYAVKIAELIRLRGIMDIEVIDTDEEIKIIEIDARLPSQTPVAVYHATGMNYIKELYDLFVNGDFTVPLTDKGFCSTYRQYLVRSFGDHERECPGEHILVEGGLLAYDDELSGIGTCVDCGSRAVTDRVWSRENGAEEWRGAFINWAVNMEILDKEVEKWKHIP